MKKTVFALIVALLVSGSANAQSVATPGPSQPVLASQEQALFTLVDLNAQCLNQVAQLTKAVQDQTVQIQAINDNVKSIWAQVGVPLVKYVLPAVGTFIAGLKIKG